MQISKHLRQGSCIEAGKLGSLVDIWSVPCSESSANPLKGGSEFAGPRQNVGLAKSHSVRGSATHIAELL